MRPLLLAVFTLAAALMLAGHASAPASADLPARAAAVCADFPNQAAAQKAANTRDADGDGIYCEDLPCPCAGPNGGSTSPQPTAPSRRPKLRASINLAPWTKRTGCRVRGALPDHACTPGARFKYATKSKVCRPGYSSAVRHVTDATKRAVYEAYGMTRRFNGANGEVDHLQSGSASANPSDHLRSSVVGISSNSHSGWVIDHLVSLEIGGTNSTANLFPQRVKTSRRKDRLENYLHDQVCSGRMKLRDAQHAIASDWVAAATRAGL